MNKPSNYEVQENEKRKALGDLYDEFKDDIDWPAYRIKQILRSADALCLEEDGLLLIDKKKGGSKDENSLPE